MKLKPLICIVDDNEDILFNLSLILESHDYDVLSATSGRDALKKVSELEYPPDIIISDIMMPDINGYDFFKKFSNNPQWSEIPFIFLSARASPEDIRLGKMLGVDDYLTKPILEDDLIASIVGKLSRSKKVKKINNKLTELFHKYNLSIDPSIQNKENALISLFFMKWDDVYGPELISCSPDHENLPYSIKDIGIQLFSASIFIYGQEIMHEADSVLVNLDNIKMNAFAYFDSYEDSNKRSGQQEYMLAVIAPKINYFESLEIKNLLRNFSQKIRGKKSWEIIKYSEKITEILSSSLV